MYKNMSGKVSIEEEMFFLIKKVLVLAVLTNIEKINSLPMEMQTISLEKFLSTQLPNKRETKPDIKERTGLNLL